MPPSDTLTNLLAEAGDDALSRLAQSNTAGHVAELARQLKHEMEEKDTLEERLSKVNDEINRLKTKELPEALALMDAKEWTTTDGITVEIRDVVQATLSKDPLERGRQLEWLEDNGLGDIIKHTVQVQINKGDAETQRKVLGVLTGIGAITVTNKDDVHPQTFAAAIRGLLKEGKSVPIDLLKVYLGKTTHIKHEDN